MAGPFESLLTEASATEENMRLRCSCSSSVRYGSYYVTCLECSRPCCPSCTFIFESATYCVACAESIVGVAGLARSVRETSPDDATFGMAVIRG
jgi:hypothetical protein